jgi:hypothetical protein
MTKAGFSPDAGLTDNGIDSSQHRQMFLIVRQLVSHKHYNF